VSAAVRVTHNFPVHRRGHGVLGCALQGIHHTQHLLEVAPHSGGVRDGEGDFLGWVQDEHCAHGDWQPSLVLLLRGGVLRGGRGRPRFRAKQRARVRTSGSSIASSVASSRCSSAMMGKVTLCPVCASMSRTHAAWESLPSQDSAITFTPRRSNSGANLATCKIPCGCNLSLAFSTVTHHSQFCCADRPVVEGECCRHAAW